MSTNDFVAFVHRNAFARNFDAFRFCFVEMHGHLPTKEEHDTICNDLKDYNRRGALPSYVTGFMEYLRKKISEHVN